MEVGIYDRAADEIIRRYGLVRSEIVRRNKGKKPFRMEPMSKDDARVQYMATDHRVHEAMRQQYPEYVDYEEKLMGGV